MKRLISLVFLITACSIYAQDISPHIGDLLNKQGVEFIIEESGDFRIVFQISSDRYHEVYITPVREAYGKMASFRVYSFAGVFERIDRDLGARLMLENASKKIGRWGVLNADNYNAIVLVHSLPLDTDARELFDILSIMAREADSFESQYKTDLF